MTTMKSGMGMLKVALLAGWALNGCGGTKANADNEFGTLAFPLTSYGPSGAKYQLRHATFDITSPYYYDGYSGAGPNGTAQTSVSSETDPEAPSISVDLEQGYYQIHLLPGWSLERVENGASTPVEAQLLSGEWQSAFVSPRSTSSVSYQFGIGDRKIWFNGKLNIEVKVYEDPGQYYGYGSAGAAGAAGAVGAGGGDFGGYPAY